MKKVYRIMVFIGLFLCMHLFIKMSTSEGLEQYDTFLGNIIVSIIIFVLGIISIISGLKGWKFFGIRLAIRKMKYGELLNAIVMISLGICLLCFSIEMLFT